MKIKNIKIIIATFELQSKQFSFSLLYVFSLTTTSRMI